MGALHVWTTTFKFLSLKRLSVYFISISIKRLPCYNLDNFLMCGVLSPV